MVAKANHSEGIQFLTPAQGWEILDQQAQRYLQMSGRQFIDAWQAGEIPDPDRPEVMRVVMLLPLAQQ